MGGGTGRRLLLVRSYHCGDEQPQPGGDGPPCAPVRYLLSALRRTGALSSSLVFFVTAPARHVVLHASALRRTVPYCYAPAESALSSDEELILFYFPLSPIAAISSATRNRQEE